MFQAYSAIFTTSDILRHICPLSGILADSCIFRMLAQLYIFMYINEYSELMAYPGILGIVDIFSQFQTLFKSNPCIF